MSDESRPGSEEHSESENGDEQRVALPSWNRSRSKRKANVKAEESEDAFQRGVRQASKRAATHPWVAMAGVFVVAGVVAGASFLLKNQDAAKAEVTAKLADAVAAEYRGKVVTKDVIDRFGPKRVTPNPFFEENEARDRAVEEALAELEGDSEKTIVIMGELARGNRALREGNFEEASARFNAFLAGTDPQHPLYFLAKEGQGFALEGSGDLEGALAAFGEIGAKKGKFYRDMALFHRGRVLEALGRKDEAIALYKTHLEEYPDEGALAQNEVRDRLKELAPDALEGAQKKTEDGPAADGSGTGAGE